MRILVLGGTGMLGHKMFQKLRMAHEQTWTTVQGSLRSPELSRIELFQQGNVIEGFNALDSIAVRSLIEKHQPGVIVNCIGVIKHRQDIVADALSLISLNSLLPHQLSQIAQQWEGRVIHFGTDCVFNGKKGGYVETDPSDAEDLYGKSKYLGEVTSSNSITLRTSMIGRELFNFRSLLDWFLMQPDGSQVNGYTHAYYSGLTTNLLADIVCDLIDKHPKLSGLFQATGHTISKYDLLCLIRDIFKKSLTVVPEEKFFCDRSMIGEKFRQATGFIAPDWPTLMEQLATDGTPYAEWIEK